MRLKGVATVTITASTGRGDINPRHLKIVSRSNDTSLLFDTAEPCVRARAAIDGHLRRNAT